MYHTVLMVQLLFRYFLSITPSQMIIHEGVILGMKASVSLKPPFQRVQALLHNSLIIWHGDTPVHTPVLVAQWQQEPVISIHLFH